MGNYGAAVSRPGVDVKSAAAKDMLFYPSVNMLKVSAQRILINDGSNDRVLVGYNAGGF